MSSSGGTKALNVKLESINEKDKSLDLKTIPKIVHIRSKL